MKGVIVLELRELFPLVKNEDEGDELYGQMMHSDAEIDLCQEFNGNAIEFLDCSVSELIQIIDKLNYWNEILNG